MIEATEAFAGTSVDSIANARPFYEEVLGLTVLDDTMGLKLALPGGGSFYLYEKQGHVPASYTVLNFNVADIAKTVAELSEKHGIVFEKYDDMPAPQDENGILWGKESGYGPNIAWFKDPAGNTLSVVDY